MEHRSTEKPNLTYTTSTLYQIRLYIKNLIPRKAHLIMMC